MRRLSPLALCSSVGGRFLTRRPPQLQRRLCSLLPTTVPPEPEPADQLLVGGCTEDVSHYVLETAPTFNFAAYADRSPLLEELVKLGVDLSKVERTRGAVELILRLNWERDAMPVIRFLHDVGVPSDKLGHYLTKNPFIFKESMENLQIRINYLESKLFNNAAVARIVSTNPTWLSYSTKDIDFQLGFLQSCFALKGHEVREVTVKMPKLITYPTRRVEVLKFGVREEMGFSEEESKQLLLAKPKVYTLRRSDVVSRFDYAHSEMGLSHSQVLSQPDILTHRLPKIRERHLFLKAIGRDRYDPTSPGFVSLRSLLSASDADFCSEVAKTNIVVYNKFLKTL